jgi:amino acid transporter
MLSTTSTFLRDSTGLVRNISARDALMINALWYSFFGVWWNYIFVGLYPGADILVSIGVGALGMAVIGVVYVLLGIAMPRTGGDYIWTSRVLNPLLGFMTNFYFVMVMIGFIPLVAGSLVPGFINGGLVGANIVSGDPTYTSLAAALTSQNSWIPYLVAASPLIMLTGARRAIGFMWVSCITAVVALLIAIAAFATTGPAGFISNFNAHNTMTYANVIATAQNAGFTTSFTTGGTILASVYTFFLILSFPSAYFTGEIRGASKINTQVIAMYGSVIAIVVYAELLFYYVYSVVGASFFHSVSFLFSTASSSYQLPFTYPQIGVFVAYEATNPAVPLAVNLLLAISCVGSCVAWTFPAVRSFFAFSFDRILPSKLSTVDSKGTAWVAILLSTAASEIYTALFLLTPASAYVAYEVFGWALGYVVLAVAAMILPYRRKDIFNAAPETIRKTFAGIPIISIAGIGMAVFSAVIAYGSISPAYAGTLNPIFLLVVFMVYFVAAAIYAISYFVRKRQGISLAMVMREIPPE